MEKRYKILQVNFDIMSEIFSMLISMDRGRGNSIYIRPDDPDLVMIDDIKIITARENLERDCFDLLIWSSAFEIIEPGNTIERLAFTFRINYYRADGTQIVK